MSAMGTHNALVGLGPRFYLEVIAVDPEGEAPPRPRWFDLDEPRMKAALAEGPQLVHWVARTNDIAAAAARLPELGAVTPMARGDFTWRITIPDDGHRPGRGLVPTLIEWTRRAASGGSPARFRTAPRGDRRRAPRAGIDTRGNRQARIVRRAESHVRQVPAARGDDPHAARHRDSLGIRHAIPRAGRHLPRHRGAGGAAVPAAATGRGAGLSRRRRADRPVGSGRRSARAGHAAASPSSASCCCSSSSASSSSRRGCGRCAIRCSVSAARRSPSPAVP